MGPKTEQKEDNFKFLSVNAVNILIGRRRKMKKVSEFFQIIYFFNDIVQTQSVQWNEKERSRINYEGPVLQSSFEMYAFY